MARNFMTRDLWTKMTALKIYYVKGAYRSESMTSTFVVGYRDTCLVLREKMMLDHLHRLHTFISRLDGKQLVPWAMGSSAKYARLSRWVGDILEGGWVVSVCFRGPWGFSAGGFHFVAENRHMMARVLSYSEPGLVFLMESRGMENVTSQIIAGGIPLISMDTHFQDLGQEVSTPYFLPTSDARGVLFYTRMLVCFFKQTVGTPVANMRPAEFLISK